MNKSDDSNLQSEGRKAWWQLSVADVTFRLCFNKPADLTNDLGLRSISANMTLDVAGSSPKATTTITEMIWRRLIHIIQDFFEARDNQSLDLQKFAIELDNLLTDWNIVSQ